MVGAVVSAQVKSKQRVQEHGEVFTNSEAIWAAGE